MVVRREQQKTFLADRDIWKEAATAVQNAGGMDQRVFLQLIRGLWSQLFRKDSPDDNAIRGWYVALGDMSEHELAGAIVRFVRERSSDFPSIQALRELSGVQATSDATGMLAWETATEAIRIVGSYAVPQFDDPAISHAISNLGGWTWFCNQSPEQLRKFERQRFLKTYDAFSSMPKLAAIPLKCLSERPGNAVPVGLIGGRVAARIGG